MAPLLIKKVAQLAPNYPINSEASQLFASALLEMAARQLPDSKPVMSMIIQHWMYTYIMFLVKLMTSLKIVVCKHC